MTHLDKKKFAELINVCASIYSKELTNAALAAFYEMLKDYEISDIDKAFYRHMKTSKFFPTPADIIEYLPGDQNHMGADQAWGIALKSFDEAQTVVMTMEIANARDACLEIYHSGDTTAARMAFRDAYNDVIKLSGKPEYFVSPGWDKQNRSIEVRLAIDRGYIKYEKGKKYLINYNPEIKFKQLMDLSEKWDQTEEERKAYIESLNKLKNIINIKN